MRIADRGAIRPGFHADLVLLDDKREVLETWIGGRSEPD
jgi:N-acetylglucosamine-6-phosphate deacetylase